MSEQTDVPCGDDCPHFAYCQRCGRKVSSATQRDAIEAMRAAFMAGAHLTEDADAVVEFADFLAHSGERLADRDAQVREAFMAGLHAQRDDSGGWTFVAYVGPGWLHDKVVAGEREAFAAYLATRQPKEPAMIHPTPEASGEPLSHCYPCAGRGVVPVWDSDRCNGDDWHMETCPRCRRAASLPAAQGGDVVRLLKRAAEALAWMDARPGPDTFLLRVGLRSAIEDVAALDARLSPPQAGEPKAPDGPFCRRHRIYKKAVAHYFCEECAKTGEAMVGPAALDAPPQAGEKPMVTRNGITEPEVRFRPSTLLARVPPPQGAPLRRALHLLTTQAFMECCAAEEVEGIVRAALDAMETPLWCPSCAEAVSAHQVAPSGYHERQRFDGGKLDGTWTRCPEPTERRQR